MADLSLNISGVKALRLNKSHLDEVISLMNREGWYYYDYHELERYIELNQDCFSLSRNGHILGSIFTTNYGNQAWIGNIIVAEDVRGMGMATELIRAVRDFLHENRQISTFRLGSVPLAIGLYKRLGFHAEGFTTSQEADLPLDIGNGSVRLDRNFRLEKIREDDLESIAEIDECYFKSHRLEFLRQIFRDSVKEACLCLKDRDKIQGYLMVRKRTASKTESGFAQGPDHVYRLGPSCILPACGMAGFKALMQNAICAVNNEVRQIKGQAKLYAVFPKNADRQGIYRETRELARAMGMDSNINLDKVFDEHDLIFGRRKSIKNEAQWTYMKGLGFHQEYFEQIMSFSFEAPCAPPHRLNAETGRTQADTEGIFALATPGDKA